MKYILTIIFSLLLLSVNAQFTGTDSLRNYNNRFITNDPMRAFTNNRLHNLIGGLIDFIDMASGGGSVSLGVDTMYVTADSIFHYKKNGVFRSFVIRGNPGAGRIYEIPFGDGAGRFSNDSNFRFDASQGANNMRLVVGPVAVNDGGLSKINATSDNMNAASFTSFGTGINTIIFRRALGSVGLPLSITQGTDLWNFSGRGYDGTAFTSTSRAAMYAQTAQDWTSSAQGTRVYVATTSNDTSLLETRMVIDDSLQIAASPAATTDSIAGLRRNANGLATVVMVPAGSMSGAPSGPAGGDLTGTYPNPTIANNAVTTSKITDSNVTNSKIASFTTYPEQSTMGQIWYDSAFTDLSDFIPSGPPSGSPSVSLSNGKIVVTNSTISDRAIVAIKKYRVTNLSHWTFSAQAKTTGQVVGFGIGLNSIFPGDNTGVHVYAQTTGGNTFQLRGAYSGNVLNTGTAPTINNNDVLEFVMTRNDTLLTTTVRNVTTGVTSSPLTYPYSLIYSGAPTVSPNDCYFHFVTFGDNFEILSHKFSSDEIKNPAGLYMADSKGNYFSGATSLRTADILKNSYSSVVGMSSPDGRLYGVYNRLDELYQMNPEWVIISDLGSNDIRHGERTVAQVQAMLTDVTYKLGRNGSTRVYAFVMPEDSTASGTAIGMAPLKQWIAAQPFGVLQNAIWDSLSTSNKLKLIYNAGDGIHINAAGHAKVADILLASGLLSGKNPKNRTPFIKGDDNISLTGNVPHLSFDWKRVPNTVQKVDTSGNVGPSIMHDDGNTVVFSTNYSQHIDPPSNLPYTRAIFDGNIAITGNNGAIGIIDRTTTDRADFAMANGVLQLFMNSTDRFHWDVNGFHTIGSSVTGRPGRGIFHIYKDRSFNSAQGLFGLGITLDSATYTQNSNATMSNTNQVSFFPMKLQGTGSTTYNNPATVFIAGAPYAGASTTVNSPYSLNVNAGKVRIRDIDSTATAPNIIYQDPVTGDIKKSGTPAIVLKGSTTWAPGIVAVGSSATTNITVTGVVAGDPVTISKATGGYSNGEIYDAFVSAANTVTIRVHNVSTGSANYSSSETYNVVVLKY